MNIPKFTAEASLYEASGYYQTSRRTLNLCRQTNSAIYPAMMGEVVTVGGCGPGLFQWGDPGGEEGVDWGCVDPLEGGGDGSAGSGPVVVPDDGGSHGRAGGSRANPKKGADPTRGFRFPAGLRWRCSVIEQKNCEDNYGEALDRCIKEVPKGEDFVVKCGSNTGDPFCCWSNTPTREWKCKAMPKNSEPSTNAR
jgi:hypothetical protein